MRTAETEFMGEDAFGSLLGLWSERELEEAVPERTRARQARWPLIGIFLLLWQWALENRTRTFEKALPMLWPTTRAFVRAHGKAMAPLPVTPVALLKGRKILNTKPLLTLWSIANDKALSRFDPLTRTLGLRAYAVDGSWLNLPHAEALVEEFGRPQSAGKNKPMPQLLMVTMDLVNLGWFTDVRLGRYDDSELTLAMEMTASLGKGDLLLGDRLFFETPWMAGMVGQGVELLLRVSENRVRSFTEESINEVLRQRQLGVVVDCKVDLKVATNHHGKPLSLLRMRYVEITIHGEVLRFLTTLSEEKASAARAAELYLARWGIETDYRLFKGPDHLPVVLSRTPMTVRQEILLRVLAHNSVRFVQAEACMLEQAPHPVQAGVFSLQPRLAA